VKSSEDIVKLFFRSKRLCENIKIKGEIEENSCETSEIE